jgi:hypothetical protein
LTVKGVASPPEPPQAATAAATANAAATTAIARFFILCFLGLCRYWAKPQG